MGYPNQIIYSGEFGIKHKKKLKPKPLHTDFQISIKDKKTWGQ